MASDDDDDSALLVHLPFALRVEWESFMEGGTRLSSGLDRATRRLRRAGSGKAVQLYSMPLGSLDPRDVQLLVGFGARRDAHDGHVDARVQVDGRECFASCFFHRDEMAGLLSTRPLPLASMPPALRESTLVWVNGLFASPMVDAGPRGVYAICAVCDDATSAALADCDFDTAQWLMRVMWIH
jgi:hypothetical protein